jgi:hypothetical protein
MNQVFQLIQLESKWVEQDNSLSSIDTSARRLETEQKINETKNSLLQSLISLEVVDSGAGSSHLLVVDDNPAAVQYLLKCLIRILGRLSSDTTTKREEKKLLLRIFEIFLQVFRIFRNSGSFHIELKLEDYHSLTILSLFFLESMRKIFYVSSPSTETAIQQNDADYEYLLEMLLDFLTLLFSSLPILFSDNKSFSNVPPVSSSLLGSYATRLLKENVFSQIIHSCLFLSTYQSFSPTLVTLNYSRIALKSLFLIRGCLQFLTVFLPLQPSVVIRFCRQSFPGIFSSLVNFVRKSLSSYSSSVSSSVIKM